MITVFGSINADLIFPVPALPMAGQTVQGGAMTTEPGGKGANQALAAARDGATVTMAGAIGPDALADIALTLLRASRIDLTHIATTEHPTGCACICTDPAGRNQIVVAPGANLHARQADIPLRATPGLTIGSTIITQMEVDPAETAALIRRAHAAGSRTIHNHAPAAPLDPAALALLDILIVNEDEAAWLAQHQSIPSSITLIRTLGAGGVEWQNQQGRGHIPATKITPVDTTAAGDCFVGVLAAALDRGTPLPEAIARANLAAGLACERPRQPAQPAHISRNRRPEPVMTNIEGIIPVMITPFTDDDRIDYPGLERLIEWYLAHRVDALFAVCQSSEMQFLSLQERQDLGRFVVKQTAGRVPVIVSGHISDAIDDQVEELTAAANTGADAIILVTNHLDPAQTGEATFTATLETLLARLPTDIPLGLYECPAPYRRLLSDSELTRCIDTGRFTVLKDVSCDLPTITHRVALAKNSPLAIVNANAAIARDAMRAGSRGFTGIATNFHPDLYQWLRSDEAIDPALSDRLTTFLVLAALSEAYGYPALAKLYHQRLGTFASMHTRALQGDLHTRFWALNPVLDQLSAGTEAFRTEISHLPTTR